VIKRDLVKRGLVEKGRSLSVLLLLVCGGGLLVLRVFFVWGHRCGLGWIYGQL